MPTSLVIEKQWNLFENHWFRKEQVNQPDRKVRHLQGAYQDLRFRKTEDTLVVS